MQEFPINIRLSISTGSPVIGSPSELILKLGARTPSRLMRLICRAFYVVHRDVDS